MLDVRLLSSKRPKSKRVTHSVKETGLIGGMSLVALTTLKEQGEMCRNQLADATGMTKIQASNKLQDLFRHELIEKTGAMNGKRHVYRAKEKE